MLEFMVILIGNNDEELNYYDDLIVIVTWIVYEMSYFVYEVILLYIGTLL
jgi:hypothetical protein